MPVLMVFYRLRLRVSEMRPSGALAVHARPLPSTHQLTERAQVSAGAKLLASRERKSEGGGHVLYPGVERGVAAGAFLPLPLLLLLLLLLFVGCEWGYSSKERCSLSMTRGGGGPGRPG